MPDHPNKTFSNHVSVESSITTDFLGNTITDTINRYEGPSAISNESVEEDIVRASVNDLPLEVLVQIFANLDPSQLSSLRLVCKHWNRAVLDKTTWSKSFTTKFGTGSQFASVSGSRQWIIEYFNRMKVLKKWNKGTGIHRTYQLITNSGVYDHIGNLLTNFDQNRLMAMSLGSGGIIITNLNDGKNQIFIPGNELIFRLKKVVMNWNYLLMVNDDNEIFLKNLNTSTSSGSTRISTLQLIDPEDEREGINSRLDEITSVEIKKINDKHKEAVDIITSSRSGVLKFWTIGGKLIKRLALPEGIHQIKSDFKKSIIVVGLTKIFILNFYTLEMVDIDIKIPANYVERCKLDIDYGGTNIIMWCENLIEVINYQNPKEPKYKSLKISNEDGYIVDGKLQTCLDYRLNNYDDTVVGGDALYYGIILSSNKVIIWNIRDSNSRIQVQTVVEPIFSKYHPQVTVPEGETDCYVKEIAFNSSVLLISGYNGFTNLYNVHTGEYLREISVKFPKKFNHFNNIAASTGSIRLSEDEKLTCGVIVCLDIVQYFEFGEQEKSSSNVKRRVNVGPQWLNKQLVYQSIKDQMDDFDRDEHGKRKEALLVDKYNGIKYDNEDDELSVALAMSESFKPNKPTQLEEEEQLRLVLEMSKQEEERKKHLQRDQWDLDDLIDAEGSSSSKHTPPPDTPDDEEEQLRRIIELSLIDQ